MTAGVAVMVCRGSLTTEQLACAFSLLRVTCEGQFGTISDACRRLNSSAPKAGLIPSRGRRSAEASRAYGSVALGLSRSVPDEFRELAEKEL